MTQILSTSIILILALTSCGSAKETIVKPVISDIIKGKSQVMLYNDEKTDSVTSSIDYSYFTPSKFVYRDSVNQIIQKFVIQITGFGSDVSNKSSLSNSFFQAQLDTFDRISRSENEGFTDQLWELESSIEIDDSRETFVQLKYGAWSYTGGAHGNGYSKTVIIDKYTSKEILLNDLFSDVSAVTAIGESYFRKLYELEPDADLDDAGFWFENNLFHLNNNFSIESDKIVFVYSSYEIAPYSGGETVIEIPIEEIKNYIKIKI